MYWQKGIWIFSVLFQFGEDCNFTAFLNVSIRSMQDSNGIQITDYFWQCNSQFGFFLLLNIWEMCFDYLRIRLLIAYPDLFCPFVFALTEQEAYND